MKSSKSTSDQIRSMSKVTPRMSTVFGFGINDADYAVTASIGGKMVRCPAYVAWANMLKRCYCKEHLDKYPTYNGVVVCEEWLSFMRFRKWWSANHVDGFVLDKDIIVTGNREYHPDKCIYVPNWINTFTVDSVAIRGEYPIGVALHKQSGRYLACCKNMGRHVNIGLFCSPESAHLAWRRYKLALALDLKCEMDEVDKRIYKGIVSIISAAR